MLYDFSIDMTSVPLSPPSGLSMVSPWSWNPTTITVLGAVCTILLVLIYHKTISLCLFEVFRILWRRLLIVMNQNHSSSDLCNHGGLSSTILERLPAIQFKKTDIECGKVDGDCPICLGEFMEGEWLRSLPKCSHVFHSSCIDAWFQSHSNCPLCRTDVAYNSDCHPSNSLPTLLGTLMRENVTGERGSSYHLHVSISLQTFPDPVALQGTEPGEHRLENTESVSDSPSSTLFIVDQNLPGQRQAPDSVVGSSSIGEHWDHENAAISALSESDLRPRVIDIS